MQTQPPTIKDVAKKAGVSTSLVSLVINNRPKVSPHREGLVRAAMDELGYTPPPPARRRGPRLNTRRPTHRIAMVMAHRGSVSLQAPVYSDLLHSVADAVANRGKALTIHHIDGNELTPEISNALRQSDGVIFFGNPIRGPLYRELQSRPCVRVMGTLEPQGFWDHVTYNNSAIGKIAAEYVLQLECSRACYMGPVEHRPESDAISAERGITFRETLESAGCWVTSTGAVDFVSKAEGRHSVDTAKFSKALQEILSASNPPQAIFVPGDLMANTLHSMLLSHGKRPGMDLHIVSVNNERLLLDHLTPRPTTVDIHPSQIGRAAVDLLHRRIADPSVPRSVLVLQPTLVPGGKLIAAQ